jgi:hypothetical protein
MSERSYLLSALVLLSALHVYAQVETVAMRTTGISCGVCAAISEIQFKRVAGVDKIAISLAKETIVLSYKPDAPFSPRQLHAILQPLEVGIVQFQISARGRVQEQSGKRFFIAGKDKFVLVTTENTPTIPLDTPHLIEAILNDRPDPMELLILTFKPLTQAR